MEMSRPLKSLNAALLMPTGTEPVTSLGILEGECGYRPSNSGGDVGNPLM